MSPPNTADFTLTQPLGPGTDVVFTLLTAIPAPATDYKLQLYDNGVFEFEDFFNFTPLDLGLFGAGHTLTVRIAWGKAAGLVQLSEYSDLKARFVV
jgi:hypothetical protein